MKRLVASSLGALSLAIAAACSKPSAVIADAAVAAPITSSSASTTASASAAPTSPPPNETLDERTARVHNAAIIVDGHNDVPTKIIDDGFDLGKPDGKSHTDLPRMKSGGITGEFFSIYVDHLYAEHGGAARRALDLIDVTYRQVERYPNDLILATSASDIRRAKRDGKIAVLMGIEGGHAIENSLFTLRDMYRLGVRYMTLTHINTNDWADSAGGFSGPAPVRHHGLTDFGRGVVREMQRIGMLVDVSHVSDETFFATIAVAKAPIIASHSSSRAVCDQRRNLTDDMLRALAKNGGIAMVNFWSRFVDPEYAAGKRATGRFSLLIDHIDHMVQVAGVDHVGLGSDFDGVPALPDGITGIGDLPKITRALLERGYSDDDVTKILGASFLRVMEAAEAYAKSTATTLSGDGSLRTLQRGGGGGGT